jgi:hypothetical protein
VSGDDPGESEETVLYNDSLDLILTRLGAAMNVVLFEDAWLDLTEECESFRRMLR